MPSFLQKVMWFWRELVEGREKKRGFEDEIERSDVGFGKRENWGRWRENEEEEMVDDNGVVVAIEEGRGNWEREMGIVLLSSID